MHFLGYHGTSEAHALSIINNGVRPEKLSPRGQIGKGFYIAKMNKSLPDWGAEIATTEGRNARSKEWYSKSFFERVLCILTGNNNLPVPPEAKKTVLKVYSTEPLDSLKWSVMKTGDLGVIKSLSGGLSEEMAESKAPEWLQMVIPVDKVHLLVCRRDDGVAEQSAAWRPRETAFDLKTHPTPPALRKQGSLPTIIRR